MGKRLFSIRSLIGFFIFFLVFMSSLGTFIYILTGQTVKRQLGNHCLGIATAAVVLLEQDPESFRDFCQTLNTESNYYRTVKRQLEEIRHANGDNIRFLYAEIRISDTEMMYILDGEKADAELFSPPGSIDLLSDTEKVAYESRAPYIADSFSANNYGRLLNSYAPIHARDGTVLGLVGVDVTAEKYYEVMGKQLFVIIASVVLSTVMMIVLSTLLIRMYHSKLQSEHENLSKTTFLASMSHEIRTPMNAIVGMNELILRENLSPAAREQALNVRQAAANLLSIINDILDFSKIESGKMKVVDAPYQFSSLINDVISIIRTRLSEKSIRFIVNLDSRIPDRLIGDEIRIRQILLNVLSNAAKYTPKGLITFSVDCDFTDEHAVNLTVRVTDTGIGIKQEHLDKIFGDFTQVDLYKNRGVVGTGLGLAITRNLCRLLNGDIRVSSIYGQGSTFTVTLPQQFEEDTPCAAVTDAGAKAVLLYETRSDCTESIAAALENLGVRCTAVTSHSMFLEELQEHNYSHAFVSSFLGESIQRMLNRLHSQTVMVLLEEYGEHTTEPGISTIAMPTHVISIANLLNGVNTHMHYSDGTSRHIRFTAPDARVLVVDDINTNLRVAEGLMSPFKMQVDCALSGKEALILVQKESYDLILMDHMMPEMDGIETTEQIRALGEQDEYYRHVPIIALTANAVSGMQNMFLQNGMNDFLAKPINTRMLYALLKKWIPEEKQIKQEFAEQLPPIQAMIIPEIDTALGLSMTGGDPGHYRQILQVFCRDCKEKTEQLHSSLLYSDFPLFTTYAHAMKSSAASIGASALSKSAERMEQAGKSEDMEYIGRNIESFLRQLIAVTESISIYLGQNAGGDEQQPANDYQLLYTQLTALRQALTAINIETTNTALQLLLAESWNSPIQEQLEQIERSILMFEYEEAIGDIDRLLENNKKAPMQ